MNEWVIVAIVAIVVIFGATKLPNIARNVGKAQGEFKKGLKEGVVPEEGPSAPATPPANSEPPPPAAES
jgi:sec-independent protein translocase protein TatA